MNKYNLVRFSTSAFLASVALLATASIVSADSCTTQYGNGQYSETCVPTELSVDKQVRNPITGVFVENLVSGDAAYSPNSEVIYKLKFVNSGNENFGDVTITDTLPGQLTGGTVVEADKAKIKDEKFENGTLTFKLKDEFRAGTTVEVQIKAQVKDASVFTEAKTCDLTNTARIQSGNESGDDTAKICVTKDVLGTTTLPQAGPEDYLPLLPFVFMGITGAMLLVKRS